MHHDGEDRARITVPYLLTDLGMQPLLFQANAGAPRLAFHDVRRYFDDGTEAAQINWTARTRMKPDQSIHRLNVHLDLAAPARVEARANHLHRQTQMD